MLMKKMRKGRKRDTMIMAGLRVEKAAEPQSNLGSNVIQIWGNRDQNQRDAEVLHTLSRAT